MKYLSFDLRALAIMRMAVAIVILLDLSVRLSDLEAFYSNTGVVPLPLLFEHGWNDYFLSIHVMSGLWQVQLVLFLAALTCAVFLLLGYRTTLFTVLSWFMMMSLHNRNGFILQGGDDLLRMVLFWGMFIPWGQRYSCDRILGAPPATRTIFTVATFAYLLQICYIYTGSALLKGKEWHTDFSAMYFVYGLEQIAYPVTKTFFYHPGLLKILTAIAYYFELFVPVLFFMPFKHQFFRAAGVLLIIGFHALNCMTLFIGMFPLIGISTSLGMLPSSFMDLFERKMVRVASTVRLSFTYNAQFINKVIRWRPPYRLPLILVQARMAMLIFLTVFVFDWNFSNLTFVNSKLSDNLRFIGYTLRLDQNWGMFAPGVFKDDGWYVMEGVDEKNNVIDLLRRGARPDYGKPADITAMFRNDRWRKYTENLIITWQSYLRGYFCNYSRRIWNESGIAQKIKAVRIVYMSEFTNPGYKFGKPQRAVLCECP
jgi:hypothetical protein